MENETCVSQQSIPLNEGASIKWMGISSKGMVLIRDSNGLVKGILLTMRSLCNTQLLLFFY